MAVCAQIEYKGWRQAYRITNGSVELVVVSEIGPRIMSVALPGGHNMFRELPAELGLTGGDAFRLYGGQRLWAAPENTASTYYPDNVPAEFRQLDENRFAFTAPVETGTGLRKEMEIQLPADEPAVRVVHRITNEGADAREFSPWALSVMNLHGTAIVPLPPYGSHAENLSPVSVLSLWAYTDLTDPRWVMGDRYVLLRQDALAGTPQKLGLRVKQGWAGYVLDGVLFVKRFGCQEGATYPDFDSNCEIFTDHRILEIESLGPLAPVQPGQTVSQIEDWHLIDGVETPGNDDEVEKWIQPHVQNMLAV